MDLQYLVLVEKHLYVIYALASQTLSDGVLTQAGLVEIISYARENRGCRYILVEMDVFIKYILVEAVKRKKILGCNQCHA
ncbi:hypothetical protein NQ315_002830 [Exocentrus adspersus]|uniref:Coatomer subunit zeta n=1 Tax=Exocentrus adspersus TaxID=1586481 RepID=A0AAV8VDW7_9CUCU|nr:hypothetical protein NQ315_002830 [Exocentrus adspersus]